MTKSASEDPNGSDAGENTTTGQRMQIGWAPRGAACSHWAVILAGGDGKRLLPLTRKLSGDDRPKQFCRLLGTQTLLEQTLRRVGRVVDPDHTFTVVTKSHEKFYSQLSGDFLVQPLNQGTTPAIVYSLVRVHELDPRAVVAFFPSDHYFGDDDAFSASVGQAFEFAESHTRDVVLLGVKPDRPETAYGWIEPDGPALESRSGTVFRVRRFWEKPSLSAAADLVKRGCFWNSFVIAGRVESLLGLVRAAVPALLWPFQKLAPKLFTKDEETSVLKIYQEIRPSGFSQDVLSVCSRKLAVLCSKTLQWTDVGDVDRALALIRSKGLGLPPYLQRPGDEPAVIAAAAS